MASGLYNVSYQTKIFGNSKFEDNEISINQPTVCDDVMGVVSY